MLRSSDGLEADEGNLHTQQKAQNVKRGVTREEPIAKSVHDQKGENVEGNQVDDEDVSSPGTDHVEVGQSGHRGPEDGSSLDRFDPQEVRELERENSDTLVVVASSDRSRNVPRHDGDEASGQ